MHNFTPEVLLAYVLIVECGKVETPCARIAYNTAEDVSDCPRDETQYEKRKLLKECERWSMFCSKATYHCVVNPFMNATVETCAPPVIIFGSKCAEINTGRRPIQSSRHRKGKCKKCPKSYYLSTDAYKYTECYDAVQREKTDQNVKKKTDQNVKKKTDQNVKKKTDQNVREKTDQNVKKKTNQNVKKKTDQNVTEKTDQNVKKKTDQNVKKKTDQNVTEKTDQNVTEKTDQEETDQNLTEETGFDYWTIVGIVVAVVVIVIAIFIFLWKRKIQFCKLFGDNDQTYEMDAHIESEETHLLKKITTDEQRKQQQLTVGRRRWKSESEATSECKTKEEGRMIGSVNRLLSTEEAHQERKKDIVHKGRRTRRKSESDARHMESEHAAPRLPSIKEIMHSTNAMKVPERRPFQ